MSIFTFNTKMIWLQVQLFINKLFKYILWSTSYEKEFVFARTHQAAGAFQSEFGQ